MSATKQSIGFAYDPSRWEEAIIAERFLYPQCHPHEARMLRAFGKFIFYRCLEYSGYVDRGESRIVSDLRGAARDLRLLHGFIHSTGTAFDVTDVKAEDRQYVLLASAVAPKLEKIASELESALPSSGGPDPETLPMTPNRRKVLTALRREWEDELEKRRQVRRETDAKVEQAMAEIRLIGLLLQRPDDST